MQASSTRHRERPISETNPTTRRRRPISMRRLGLARDDSAPSDCSPDGVDTGARRACHLRLPCASRPTLRRFAHAAAREPDTVWPRETAMTSLSDAGPRSGPWRDGRRRGPRAQQPRADRRSIRRHGNGTSSQDVRFSSAPTRRTPTIDGPCRRDPRVENRAGTGLSCGERAGDVRDDRRSTRSRPCGRLR